MDFPYSRGLSFYEVNDEGKITSARDIPEPTIKPGDSAIYVSCNFWLYERPQGHMFAGIFLSDKPEIAAMQLHSCPCLIVTVTCKVTCSMQALHRDINLVDQKLWSREGEFRSTDDNAMSKIS